MRVLIVDAVEPGLLGQSWRVGARLFRRHFDRVFLVRSANEAHDVLLGLRAGEVSAAQVWSHGRHGQPLIARRPLDPTHPCWRACEGGSVWFRACHVMAGRRGHAFATQLARQGVDVAGHLGVIGTWGVQSYLVGLRAGERPWWDPALSDTGPSRPWQPRTVPVTEMQLPQWAFEHDPVR